MSQSDEVHLLLPSLRTVPADHATINMLPSRLAWATIYQFKFAARYVLQDNDTSIAIFNYMQTS